MSACKNAALFDTAQLAARSDLGALTNHDDSYLRARGFDKSGSRGGGIVTPRQVTLPQGATLIRTFGGSAQAIGQWWFTAYELSQIISYAGRADVAEGRGTGKGLLHAFFAVLRKEWGSTCELFTIIETRTPLFAFYGEGDDAAIGGTGGQKAARILVGGSQRRVRQVMLPRFWDFQSAYVPKLAQGNTDLQLLDACKKQLSRPLQFE